MPDDAATMAPPAPGAEMAAPPQTPPNAMQPPGPTGPAAMAPNRQGQRLQGMVIANIGLTMLEKALPMVGSTSEEGQAIVKAIMGMSKFFQAAKSQQLGQAEMKLMGAQQGGMGGPPGMGGGPGMAVKNRLAAMGMGGGPQGAAG